ncbi:bifunctional phosphoribosylaminoimidazolecarboxamide formyltransferase/IMP cyclohydrolase [Candidatus Woesearchaeota archaeon]|nr:bifunctional phosphoribosylaminoimidazolecarboxamide formyltransferase/IMP cyclohydrolase [Candidatus Woesearchaeota archaeon]
MFKRALISVSNKDGIVGFAKQLNKLGIKIISTGNTARLLKQNKINVTLASEITKFPEMLDGRLKSIHPNIFAGILADRKSKKHMDELKKLKINPIDLVVINFYPFEDAIKMNYKEAHQKIAMENIDIGGPSLVRAAAKNHENVLVVVDKNDYNSVIEKIKGRKITGDDRKNLAAKAFSCTARYDSIINSYFNALAKNQFPEILNLTFKKIQNLRYGENPHQSASFYQDDIISESCVSTSRQLQGKGLSFNNILDVNAAFEMVKDFERPSAAVVKHTNPSGVASASAIEEAYRKAHETDPKSAFGCVVALNRNCNVRTARLMKPLFIEAVICPKFDKDALKVLNEKKNLRLLESGAIKKSQVEYDLKKVCGGILMQTDYYPEISRKGLKVVSKRKPTKEEINSLIFAWKVNKHVKSNSIVLAKGDVTVGIGAGQMSRVDAVKLAIMKSEGKSQGSVMSSDAFFPFRDGVDEAAEAGITAIIQPGGSIRDKEVIAVANERNIAMVFTGIRLFRH